VCGAAVVLTSSVARRTASHRAEAHRRPPHIMYVRIDPKVISSDYLH